MSRRHGRRQRQGASLLPLLGLSTQERRYEHRLGAGRALPFLGPRCLRRSIASRWRSVAHVHRIDIGDSRRPRNRYRFHTRHDARIETSAQRQLIAKRLRRRCRGVLDTRAERRIRGGSERRAPGVSYRCGSRLRLRLVNGREVAAGRQRTAFRTRAGDHCAGRHVAKSIENGSGRHRVTDRSPTGRATSSLGLSLWTHERSLTRSPPLISTFTPNVLFPLRCQVRLRSQAR